MLNWIKRLFAPPVDAQSLINAHTKGGEVGTQIRNAVDGYLSVRGRQIGETYLPVFRQRVSMRMMIHGDRLEETAQEEWVRYMGELAEIDTLLGHELPDKFPEPFRIADISGVRSTFDEYVKGRIGATVYRAGGEAALVPMRELDTARDRAGLPPLLLPSEGDAGSPSDLQMAATMARHALNAIEEEVRVGVERRLGEIREKFLDAFRQRLTTIHESAPLMSAARAAEVEWQTFGEHVHDIPTKLGAELDESMAEWFHLAELGGTGDAMRAIVSTRATEFAEILRAEGERIYRAALGVAT